MTESYRDLTESDVLEEGLNQFRQLLGPTLRIEQLQLQDAQDLSSVLGDRADAVLAITDAQMGGPMARVLVEAKLYPAPMGGDLVRALALRLLLMKQLIGQADAIVFAPWLSSRVRSVLREHGINYLDLSGNVFLRIERPTIIVELAGAQTDPFASRRGTGTPQFEGPKAGRLVRFLADVAPPYRAVDVAKVTGLSQAYISRLLGVLDDRGLLTRKGRQVVDVDWVELLRDRGRQQGHLLAVNSWTGWYARAGVEDVLNRLRGFHAGIFPTEANLPSGPMPLVTGSHAARVFAPLTVGGQLMIYVPAGTARLWAHELKLTGPATQALDVVVLEPPDPVVFERTIDREGLAMPAPSQLVLDLLNGTGRQPQEGQELLEVLERNQSWRVPLEALHRGVSTSASTSTLP